MDQALSAPNKASAQKYIDRLAFLARDFEGPAHNKLSELCAYVKNASGRVADKDLKSLFVRWIYLHFGTLLRNKQRCLL